MKINQDTFLLKKRAAKGFAWSFSTRLACEAFQFGAGIALARMLAPAEFGLVGMVAAFTGVAMVFRNFGIGPALVRHPEMDEELFSSAFWFNVLCSLSLASALFLAAPAIATFYGEPAVLPLCQLGALNFAIGALAMCYSAMLRRNLDYRTIGSVEMTGRLVFAAVAISLAWRSWGAFALVWGAIAENATIFLLTAYFARQPLRLCFSWHRVRPLVQFGGWVMGSQFAKHAQENVTYLLVGRFAGKGPLGLFKKAMATSTMPVRHLVWSVTDVLLPSMSRLQPGSPEIRELQIRSLRVVALLTFPACVGLAVVAEPFIVGVYGEKWQETVMFLQVFCAVTLLFCIQHQLQSALIAVGRADRLTKALGFGAVAQWLGLALGYLWAGVHGMLCGILVARTIELFLVARCNLQETATPVAVFAHILMPPAVFSLAMGLGVWAARVFILTSVPLLAELAVASLVGIFLYALSLLIFRPAAVRDTATVLQNNLTNIPLGKQALVARMLAYLSSSDGQ